MKSPGADLFSLRIFSRKMIKLTFLIRDKIIKDWKPFIDFVLKMDEMDENELVISEFSD